MSEIKQAVHDVDGSAEVILFGSQARGDVHKESDCDVLILTDEKTDAQLKQRFRRKILDIQIDEGVSIDALVRNRNAWKELKLLSLFQEIHKEGVVLWRG